MMTMKKSRVCYLIALCIVGSLWLMSCSWKVGANSPTLTPTLHDPQDSDRTVSSTPTFGALSQVTELVTTPTNTPQQATSPTTTEEAWVPIEANPTYIALYKSAEQITDGRLAFTIEEDAEGSCYLANDPIEITLVFQNLTEKAFFFQSHLSISSRRFGGDNGSLVPLLKTQDGTDWWPHYAFGEAPWWEPTTDQFEIIDAHETFTGTVVYEFPSEIQKEGTTLDREEPFVTPAPGYYLLRFIYSNSQSGSRKAWTGVIASNQIEICIK